MRWGLLKMPINKRKKFSEQEAYDLEQAEYRYRYITKHNKTRQFHFFPVFSVLSCFGCLAVQRVAMFSKAQLKKLFPRCMICISSNIVVSGTAENFSGLFRRCKSG
jgi:hypothetical protein